MQNAQIDTIKNASKKGFFSLAGRSFFIYGLQLISVVSLARWLNPYDYGIYATINGYIAISWFFTDVGISGALIQKSSEPTQSELQNAGTLQFLLGIMGCAFFWGLSQPLSKYHGLGSEGSHMFQVLSLSIPIYSLRSVHRVLFDRNMQFFKIGAIEIKETLLMYFVLLLLAFTGQGAWSFIWANIARAVGGTFLYFLSSDTRFRLRFDFRVLLPYFKFGVPYQLNAIVPALRSLIIPVILAPTLKPSDLGIITWTLGLSAIPLSLAANYNQVTFSSLSKLHLDAIQFKKLATQFTSLGILGFSSLYLLGIIVGPFAIHWIFPLKWNDAIGYIGIALLVQYLYTLRYLCAAVMNAKGIPQKRLEIELSSLVLEGVLAYLGIRTLGTWGYFYAVILSNFLLMIRSYYEIRMNFNSILFKRLAGFIVILFGNFALFQYEVHPTSTLTPVMTGITITIVTLYFLDHRLFSDCKWILKQLKPRSNS